MRKTENRWHHMWLDDIRLDHIISENIRSSDIRCNNKRSHKIRFPKIGADEKNEIKQDADLIKVK